MPLESRRLYLLFTPELCRGEPFATLAAAVAGGVEVVQWRVKQRDPDGLRRCMELCADSGVPVLVNDDVELAVASGAAGAHVGQSDMPAARARALLGPRRLLGVSTHSLAELRAAERDGADHVGFGPCFPTATKGYAIAQPAGALRAVLAATRLPVFAIGGITARNLPLLLAQGATRVAVAGAILQAGDPAAAAAELAAALHGVAPRA